MASSSRDQSGEEAIMARVRRHQAAAALRQSATATETREIIQGIRLQVTGRELVVRLGERIRWHRERGDALIEQMKKLTEVERDAADELANVLGRCESPCVILEKKLREHQERASVLTFMRDHVSPDATYRLDSADLRMTEILPEKPW
jgi:hypothetical protein